MTVSWRHMEPSPIAQERIESKLDKLAERIDTNVYTHVVISINHRYLYQVDVEVHAAQIHLTASCETDDLYRAADMALSRIERQLMRKHDRRQRARHKNWFWRKEWGVSDALVRGRRAA